MLIVERPYEGGPLERRNLSGSLNLLAPSQRSRDVAQSNECAAMSTVIFSRQLCDSRGGKQGGSLKQRGVSTNQIKLMVVLLTTEDNLRSDIGPIVVGDTCPLNSVRQGMNRTSCCKKTRDVIQ